jgi:hypothetical protein
MSISPERKAELLAEVRKIIERNSGPKPKPRPKVVTSENEVVRDADVAVSKADPNYARSDEGIVKVRRSNFVTVRMDLWEEQQRQKREDRRHRRDIDPARLGHWDDPDE